MSDERGVRPGAAAAPPDYRNELPPEASLHTHPLSPSALRVAVLYRVAVDGVKGKARTLLLKHLDCMSEAEIKRYGDDAIRRLGGTEKAQKWLASQIEKGKEDEQSQGHAKNDCD